jgi:hypothetical protein
MESIETKPPQLGMGFIEAKWTICRLDSIIEKTDYEIVDGNKIL